MLALGEPDGSTFFTTDSVRFLFILTYLSFTSPDAGRLSLSQPSPGVIVYVLRRLSIVHAIYP